MTSDARPLLVRSVEFLGGMASIEGWRPKPGVPEIALAGRSNAGKSSLINRLLGRAAVARVSKTPGRTREVNFFLINGAFVIADLPGYGYARPGQQTRAKMSGLLSGYLTGSRELAGVIHVMDARRDPTEDDHLFRDLIAESGVPAIVAATKTDKLSPSGVAGRVSALSKSLGVEPSQIIPFSSRTGAGRDELAWAVERLLKPRRRR